MPHTSPTRWERLALVLIIAIGAWLRFQHTGAIEYNIDQVYPVWQAIRTLDEGALPLVGQGTSVLFANPPLTGYLFVPVLALVRQPIAAYVVTLILNTFAIWLAYRALRWLIGTRPALVGAALFAVNPWIIEDSRRTWVQSLSPFFVCLIFWALVPILTGQTRYPRRRLLIALVGLALFAHTYLLAYALLAPVGLLLILFWRRVPKHTLIVGAAVFAVLMTLYGTGLICQWDDTTDRAQNFASGKASLSDEALAHAVRLVTGWEYAAARGTRAPAGDSALRDDLSTAVHWLWTLALIAGIGAGGIALLRRDGASPHQRNTALILLIWFLLPVAMMSYVSRVVHPFYLLLTIPAGHALAAWGIAPLLRRSLPVALVVGVVTATGAINGLNTVRFAQQTLAYPGEDLPETLPLAEAAALGDRIRAGRAPGMALLSPMENWTPVTLAGQVFRTEQINGFERAVLVPSGGALIITFECENSLAAVPFAQPAGSPLVLADGTRIGLWQVTPSDLVIAHPAAIPSDVDVTFAGWTLDGELAPGETITLDTFWRIDTLHADRGVWAFAPYAHVLDAGGAQIAIAGGDVIPALKWATGDLIAQRLALTVPADAADPLALVVGLYDSVRTRADGVIGVNAIFRLPTGGEPVYAADIVLVR
ncbi:MAG: hypothetical protein JXJ20_10085 [Anaerolineae bacterium]|nr:hypothetical protein [Anaerolineae bacterium]